MKKKKFSKASHKISSTPFSKKDLKTIKKNLIDLKDKINDRFERVAGRFLTIDARFEKIDIRFEKVDDQLVELDQKIEQRFEKAKRYMGVLNEETHHKLDLILEMLEPLPTKISDQKNRIEKLEQTIPVIEAVVTGQKLNMT